MDEKTEHRGIDPGLKSEHVLTAATITRHESATCDALKCDWKRGEAPSTYNEAIDHARQSGHAVRLEAVTVTVATVGPR